MESPVASAKAAGDTQGSWATLDPHSVKQVEHFLAGVCVAYVVVGLVGFFRNRSIMKSMERSFTSEMESQFDQVGISSGKKGMFLDGLSLCYLYATGRKGLKFIKIAAELRRRQDMFSVFGEPVFGSGGDRARVVIPFSGKVEPLIFSVVRRKDVKKIRNENLDLEIYTHSAPWPTTAPVPKALEILTENSDVVPALLPASVQKLIAENEKYIVSIHLTDRGMADPLASKEKSLVAFDFYIPSDSEKVKELVYQFSLSYADRVASLVLTNNGRDAIKQHRKQIEDILAKEREKERQEEAQRQRIEKKQKEKEDRASKSRDVQRKLEEKEAKRDIKKRNRSLMKVQK
ncbi:hypothetical protein NDN08_000840 [Rhodosorus marinus]|uniref:Coiled-coil domain-containing protein 47 n=1 Tax=Rhodosorus marinus TaxID=101924 RepID=A0AAV8UPE0_9RHOD|nr:hypothetical protein NDN08_000840 [Rhodosorus marinus]